MSSPKITKRTFDLAINKYVFTFECDGVEQEVAGKSEVECAVLVARFALLPIEEI